MVFLVAGICNICWYKLCFFTEGPPYSLDDVLINGIGTPINDDRRRFGLHSVSVSHLLYFIKLFIAKTCMLASWHYIKLLQVTSVHNVLCIIMQFTRMCVCPWLYKIPRKQKLFTSHKLFDLGERTTLNWRYQHCLVSYNLMSK
jgi:hypothetical protein